MSWYTKEGKGVSKNQPQKRAFFNFLDIYFENFWNLLKINFMFFVIITPVLLATGYMPDPKMWYVWAVLIVFELFLFGPSVMGISYQLKAIVTRNHFWVWADFKDKFVENYKNGLIIGIVDFVLLVLFFIAFLFYKNMGGLGILLSYIVVVFSAIIFIMNTYLFPIIITFDNTLAVHIKNALLFTLAHLPKNLLMLILDAVIIWAFYYITFYLISNAVIAVCVILFLLMFIIFSLIGLINTSFVWSVIKHYAVKDKKNDGEESLFSDEIIIKEEE